MNWGGTIASRSLTAVLSLCVTFIFSPGQATAQVSNLAVMPSAESEKLVPPQDLRLLREGIEDGLRESLPTTYSVMNQALINQVLNNETMGKCMEKARCENDVFQSMQLDYAVTLRLTRVGGMLEAKAIVTNVKNNGIQMGNAEATASTVRELRDKLKQLAATTLAQALTGGVGGDAQRCNVTFITQPPGGAVSVNGLQVCPEGRPKACTNIPVPAGKPRITVSMFQYATFEKAVNVPGDMKGECDGEEGLKYRVTLRDDRPIFKVRMKKSTHKLQTKMGNTFFKQNTDALRTPQGGPLQPMVYTFVSKDPSGCSREQSRRIDAKKGESYEVTFNPKPYYAGLDVEIVDTDGHHVDATLVTELGDENEIPGLALAMVSKCARKAMIRAKGYADKQIDLPRMDTGRKYPLKVTMQKR